MPIQLLPKNAKSDGTYVAFFRSLDVREMEVYVAEFVKVHGVSRNVFTSKNVKKFIDDIPILFKNMNFKAIILNVFDFNANGFKHNLEFCEVIREKFASINIPTYFISISEYIYVCSFIATKTVIEKGEIVLDLLEVGNKFAVIECKSTEGGNEKEMIGSFDWNPNLNAKNLREKIIRSTNPKKIIFQADSANSRMAKSIKTQILKDYVVEVIERQKIREHDLTFTVEMSKWLLGQSHTKYYFLPTCAREYFIGYQSSENGKEVFHEIFSVNSSDKLPLEKYQTVCANHAERSILLGYPDYLTETNVSLQQFKFIKECHYNRVFIDVDSESFPRVRCEPCFAKQIVEMPVFLDATSKSKIPFIGTYGNGTASVICYCKNDKNEYEFLDTWNGICGNDLCISFHKKKPIFGTAVYELGETNPGAFVTDLVKIMSMPPDDIKVEKHWNFKFTSDAKNPVLLQFDDFDGSQKCSSPAFLMAMLIRQHLKAIEAETGTKPTEIGFCFCDSYNQVEKERIQKQFQESCKLLKIKCNFVDVL